MKVPLTLLSALLFLFSCNGKPNNGKPEKPRTEYLIAYNVWTPDSLHEDNYDIFTMKMDGSDKKNVTNNWDVAWTYLAHRDKIFFISDRDSANRIFFLYEMDSKGENVRKISDLRLRDSWMGCRKDGQELIVVPHPKVDSLLYLINTKGEVLQKIATGMPYATDPAFSPDGKRLAFVGMNKKSRREEDFKAEIYVVNPDGSGLKQLSKYPASDTTAKWHNYKAGPPRWHPTENFITYQSKQNGKYSLYAVTPDGQKQWKLTKNPQNEGWHCWSPDGKWLAIEIFDTDQKQFHIGLMNWETKEMKTLTDTAYKFQQAPVFLEIALETKSE